MTTEERLRGNELLARYEGRGFLMSHITDYTNGLPVDANKRYLHYHRSWNELIPVVRRLLPELVKTNTRPTDKAARILYATIVNMEIEPIWKAAVAAIEVINKHKEIRDADNS